MSATAPFPTQALTLTQCPHAPGPSRSHLSAADSRVTLGQHPNLAHTLAEGPRNRPVHGSQSPLPPLTRLAWPHSLPLFTDVSVSSFTPIASRRLSGGLQRRECAGGEQPPLRFGSRPSLIFAVESLRLQEPQFPRLQSGDTGARPREREWDGMEEPLGTLGMWEVRTAHRGQC